MARLTVDHVRAGYGRMEVLHGISLTAEAGITCVLGPNGSGKSTLLKVVAGILQPWTGVIRLDDLETTRLPLHRMIQHGITMLPQGGAVFPRLSVRENLLMGGYVLTDSAEVERRLAAVVDQFPVLGDRAGQLAGSLSGGEQILLAFGRALMTRPKVLLLDEPSAGLAPKFVTRIFDIVRRLALDGISFLIVEQNVRQALAAADRLCVLVNGEKRFDGGPRDLGGQARLMELFFGRR